MVEGELHGKPQYQASWAALQRMCAEHAKLEMNANAFVDVF